MPKSNFRTLSFFFLCFSSFYFCQGQDSLRTLKSERYYYKGKVFKANYFNKKGYYTISWENDIGVFHLGNNYLTTYSFDSLKNSSITTRYNARIKNERTITFLRKEGKPDGTIIYYHKDSTTDKTYHEHYRFELAKKGKTKYPIEEIPSIGITPTFDKIQISPSRVLLDSTKTTVKYQYDYVDGTQEIQNIALDTSGNIINRYSEHEYKNGMTTFEYGISGNTGFMAIQSTSTRKRLIGEVEYRFVLNDNNQKIKEDTYLTNRISGKKRLLESIEFEYFGNKLERQTLKRGKKKYLVEIVKTYW
ncbi:hypothetical protein [Arcticibacterium luteifluviistationis]|uniref:Uncharacterized protein n=1 Tax=Arcticibacterium luteifluviistationis TaxID=1784714 RepID=A0A2Z4G868_9BACT|nr:hypothetical protein [Arcticibacterium luteifluviistationis]AWV97372.1 hypothetical protein DJ013_03970 [Arcticibacterium luteifluviistationis]